MLVERLIVHRPHPWGLLITFIELIKNPRYNLCAGATPAPRPRHARAACHLASRARVAPHVARSWSKKFTRCAPEIERLFESVARSCMPPNSGGAAGALSQAAIDTES